MAGATGPQGKEVLRLVSEQPGEQSSVGVIVGVQETAGGVTAGGQQAVHGVGEESVEDADAADVADADIDQAVLLPAAGPAVGHGAAGAAARAPGTVVTGLAAG